MGTTVLVAPEIDMGSAFVRALEDQGIHLAVAMWAVLEEYGDWRIILASSDFSKTDIFASYRRVTEVARAVSNLPFPAFTIFDMDSRFISELRQHFSSGSHTYGLRLGGQSFGGKYIQDAFVYCIR